MINAINKAETNCNLIVKSYTVNTNFSQLRERLITKMVVGAISISKSLDMANTLYTKYDCVIRKYINEICKNWRGVLKWKCTPMLTPFNLKRPYVVCW